MGIKLRSRSNELHQYSSHERSPNFDAVNIKTFTAVCMYSACLWGSDICECQTLDNVPTWHALHERAMAG